jgi:hypothetical protein
MVSIELSTIEALDDLLLTARSLFALCVISKTRQSLSSCILPHDIPFLHNVLPSASLSSEKFQDTFLDVFRFGWGSDTGIIPWMFAFAVQTFLTEHGLGWIRIVGQRVLFAVARIPALRLPSAEL